jgi:hypothetical protein
LPRPSQLELVTLAVYLLGGDRNPVDTEDVAKKADSLAPGRFAWRKYKDQINLELIRVFLSDAKKRANGAYVEGSGRTGWSLTSAGRAWAAKTGQRLVGADLRRPRTQLRAGSLEESRWRRERARLITTAAWVQWSQGAPISARDAAEVFRIDSYAQGRTRHLKVARLLELFSGDREISSFLSEASVVVEKGAQP